MLRIHIQSLKALAYYCTGRGETGDSILAPINRTFAADPIGETGYRLRSATYILLCYTLNTLSKKKINQDVKQIIPILKSIIPLYKSFRLKNPTKDPYSGSPEYLLSAIYARLMVDHPKNQLYTNESTKLALEEYSYYSSLLRYDRKAEHIESFEKKAYTLETEHVLKTKTKRLATNTLKTSFIHQPNYLSLIQKALKHDEALLISSQGVMKNGAYYLIAKNKVMADTGHSIHFFNPEILREQDVQAFKKRAFENWKSLPFALHIKKLNINKLYVPINSDFQFDVMTTDTSGKTFESLSHFRKGVNVVKVYNPIDFFCNTSEQFIQNSRDAVLLNASSAERLPFTNTSLEKWSGQSILHCLKYVSLNKPGILHILGHGKISAKGTAEWKSSNAQISEFRSIGKTTLKSDLLVLNFCFAAFKRITFLPDRDLHHYLISKGAKAVIASPYETVDQSSAYIFEKFYAYLDNGETTEDALQHAKLDYLKTHHGSLAHPMYWSTFELTSNVKELSLDTKPRRIVWEWIPMLIFLIGVSGSLVWIAVKSRQDTK